MIEIILRDDINDYEPKAFFWSDKAKRVRCGIAVMYRWRNSCGVVDFSYAPCFNWVLSRH